MSQRMLPLFAAAFLADNCRNLYKNVLKSCMEPVLSGILIGDNKSVGEVFEKKD